MSEFKGTKGKWVIEKPFKNNDGNVFIDIVSAPTECDKCNSKNLGYLIARTYKNALPKDEQIPNAKLIAAAPELLEALIEVVRISDRNNIAWNRAKEVIKKATEL